MVLRQLIELKAADYFFVSTIIGSCILSVVIEETWVKVLVTVLINTPWVNYHVIYKKQKTDK
ncbi:hypothetical protein Lmede01_08350 [Leuconostoc mesenteroides subsp. dextranicum]|nr:hypothetical protein Lmede01_08350 [Leuconostoc mesenteroides subsp. dextranicum]